MPTFREALEEAGREVRIEITADAVKRLETLSSKIAIQLREEYENFFDYLSEEIVGKFGVGNNESIGDDNAPDMIAAYTSWTALSDEWIAKKRTYIDKKGAPESTMDTYHGISKWLGKQGRLTVIRRNGKGKGKFKKARPGQVPFSEFVATKAKDQKMVTKVFGPLNLEYVLTPPNGPPMKLQRLGDAVAAIGNPRVYTGRGKSSVFASAMDGNRLTITISAFGRISPMWNESAIIDWFIKSEPANKAQWGKVNAVRKGFWKIRPIILPLIQWYLNEGFRQAVKIAVNSR